MLTTKIYMNEREIVKQELKNEEGMHITTEYDDGLVVVTSYVDNEVKITANREFEILEKNMIKIKN